MPIVVDRVSFAYTPTRPVLAEVDLTFARGVTAILGPNGCGKSTLLKLMLGLLTPGSGSVHLGNASQPLHAQPHAWRARRLVYVPQRASPALAFSVQEYIAMGACDRSAIDGALERLELRDRADEPLPRLSAGQQQRATLARALAQHTPETIAILADEPVSAMDPRHALVGLDELRARAASSVIVIVLHDLAQARRVADHVVLLSAAGRVAASGSADEVLTPERLERVFDVPFVEGRALLPAPRA